MQLASQTQALVGVVLIGHGNTASRLLDAARHIVPDGSLSDIVAVDAGEGETPWLSDALCRRMAETDRGRGVLLIVDLLGASPCRCGMRQRADHELVVLSGLNLAMLLKLASLDRHEFDAEQLARAVADSAHKAVSIDAGDDK